MNGVYATIETMKKLISAGLNSVKFSINVGTAETYKKIHGKDNFDIVMANLSGISKYIKSENLPIALFATYMVCRQNQGEVDILGGKVEDYVDDFVADSVTNQGGNMYELWAGVMLDSDYKAMKVPCSMIFNRPHITQEGYLNACCMDFENYLAVADLNKVSLLEAWNNEKTIALRRMHLNNQIAENARCYNCIHNENREIEPLGI